MAVGPGLKNLSSKQPLMRMIAGCRSSLARPFSLKRFTTSKNKIIAELVSRTRCARVSQCAGISLPAIPHKTKVHYSAERYGLMYKCARCF